MAEKCSYTTILHGEYDVQTVQVRVKPKQTVQIKVKPCVKLASLSLFDSELLTIYNQAKEEKNGKIRN